MTLLHKATYAAITVAIAITTSNVSADQFCRKYVIKRFEEGNRYLNDELKVRKEALVAAYKYDRDCVLADIRGAARSFRGHQLVSVMQNLTHQLRTIDLSFSEQMRALHAEVAERRSYLQHEFEIGLRSCRHTCIGTCCQSAPPIQPHYQHSPSTEPTIPFIPPAGPDADLETLPVPLQNPTPPPRRRTDRSRLHTLQQPVQRPHAHPTRAPRGEVDWQGIVMTALSRHLSRR